MLRVTCYIRKSVMQQKTTNKRPAYSSAKFSGFTLIELLVAATVFIIVLVTAAGIFMSVLKAQRKISAMRETQEATRYMLEAMTKELRMSTINNSPAAGAVYVLNITNAKNETFEYKFDSAKKKLLRNGVPMHADSISTTGQFYLMKSPGPIRYKITIFLQAEAGNISAGEGAIVELQTAVTPRGPQD